MISGNGSAFKVRLTTGQPVEGSFGHPVTISVICCSDADVVSQGHSLLHILLLIVSEIKQERQWRGMEGEEEQENEC